KFSDNPLNSFPRSMNGFVKSVKISPMQKDENQSLLMQLIESGGENGFNSAKTCNWHIHET
ncbi:hypothetical protein, partial [Leptolyngbya sp. FACHB-711]|uniref:hypothetical protein n=1 Tax=Leptolyngbya sp. FACHB-711 TaxID=2692813 RepID=UPI001A7E9258